MRKNPSREKRKTRTELGGKARPSPTRATDAAPNPRRVAAGKRNRAKWNGFSAAGMRRLRKAAKVNMPWRFSTGPKTAEGKARAAKNGSFKQAGSKSLRAVRRELRVLRSLLDEMRAARAAAGLV